MAKDVSCFYCGKIADRYLSEHVYPQYLWNDNSKFRQNVIFSCSECNGRSRPVPSDVEFIKFLSDLMRRSNEYADVAQEAIIGNASRHRADILASYGKSSKRTKLLIECKSCGYPKLTRIHGQIEQLKSYAVTYGECQPVLAIPATLNDSDSKALKAAGIELWDLDFLAQHFSRQLPDAEPGYFKSLLARRVERGPKLTREDQLSSRLKECVPGKRDWNLYQDLLGDILEHLFCPALKKPMPEHSDNTKTNRRDFILPNYAESGFWHFLQRNYMADFVVVDAKNHTKKVGKSEILQVGNYLKPHGAGLFGMIFSRLGCDAAGGLHTLREQWMIHRKLILVFNDEDVHAMLIAKRDGSSPEEVVEQKIERFRLSI
ncbi:hypothetical protein [Pseudomonas syringae]|uniref:HNH endonuclease n=1 Tax=Pseudomonas syringae TaxID=317 RepID=A0AB38C1T8_PSESX|nr:hypothetical protein [Pseudomonas syringae]MCK0551327.1 HNH endonuclease [Pseudomonas syringae pv. aptata]SFO57900.1 hypothetical protein SAMN05444065_1385 [Pseudomonas syringae]SFP07482.1 hypothetical protein SAMN05444063_1535 [Pseudomonas syringae]